MAKKYDLNKAIIARLLRTYLPQVPSGITYLLTVFGYLELPFWVIPTLSLVGALATALDKFLREIGFYEEVRDTIKGVLPK